MYKEFALVDLEVNPTEKTVKFFFTSNVDPDSINTKTLNMVHGESQEIYRLKYTVSKKVVIVRVLDDIVPNEEYRFNINKLIKDIAGIPLQSSLIRNVFFNTKIYSNTKILSPANHELVTGPITIEWQEILKDKRRKPILQYRLQISTDIVFNKIVVDTTISNKQTLTIPSFEKPLQYFARIRVESDGEFGKWSETVTFTYDTSDRIKSEAEKAEENPHKITPVSIYAPYNYKRDMHNNKSNLDHNPSSSCGLSRDEINSATNTLTPSDPNAASSSAVMTPELLKDVLKDTGRRSATTVRLADGTTISKAIEGEAGVIVDESEEGSIKPIVIQELKVLKRPQQGTSDAFVFEFDDEISEEDILNNIEIIRKDF